MLNQTLFDLLNDRFGEVHIVNEGQSLCGEYKYDPIKDRTVIDISAWGETYCVDCPYCSESRHRLYLNHRYGVWDDVEQSNHSHMARCFNEECLKKDTALYKDLYDRIFGMLNSEQRRSISYKRGRQPIIESGELKEAPRPGLTVSLLDLPSEHRAITYLTNRGYDVDELVNNFDLQYCTQASAEYKLAENRIVIPMVQNGMFVGWQCRYVGDLDWKAFHIPKYYTMPAMPKRLMLYNHDAAIQQEMVVITEGPTSCWAVYPFGVALLGKQATLQQSRLIINQFAHKTVIILLDGDAKVDSERLYLQLKPHIKGNLLNVTLPPNKDPGNYHNSIGELWDLVYDQAEQKGIELPVALL